MSNELYSLRSSANSLKVMVSLNIDSISLTYRIKRSDPSTEPWGTSLRTTVVDDILFSIVTASERLVMKNSIQAINLDGTL